MRNCFVPNCDAECRATANLKRMMFKTPKVDYLFDKWKEVLPKKRNLKPGDLVCERHFKPSEIVTTFEHVVNGQHFAMARGRPQLVITAIPSSNLTNSIDTTVFQKKGRKSKLKRSPKKIKLENKPKNVSEKKYIKIIEIIDDIKGYGESSARKKIEISEVDQEDFENIEKNAAEQLNDRTENIETNLYEERLLEEITGEINENLEEMFENIYEDVFEVVLPSTLWGIHRDPDKQFIAFSYYDPKIRTTTKVIEFTNKGMLKIIMCRKMIAENYCAEITHEKITEILNEIENVRMCKDTINQIVSYKMNLLIKNNDDFSDCQICAEVNTEENGF